MTAQNSELPRSTHASSVGQILPVTYNAAEDGWPVVHGGASPSDSQTRPANTTPYDAGDVVGDGTNLEFTNIAAAGAGFVITGARLRIDIAAIPSGMTSFKVRLYNAAPTPIADNAAYNLPSADRGKYIGSVTISAMEDLGDTIFGQDDGINVAGKLAAGSSTLYGILQTVGGFTPSSGDVITATLNTAGL